MSNGRASGPKTVFPAPAVVAGLLLLAAATAPDTARAQVGHDPSRSPYRDVTTRQELSVAGGWFTGNPAEANVGARPGPMTHLRLATRLSGPLDLVVTFALVNSSRYVINPDSPLTSRTTGPVNLDLVIPDLALGFNLTGRKSWHGVAPYLGIGAGIALPTASATDPGGYEAGSNFTFVPTVGARVYLSRSLALQLEARDYFMRYEYPLFFFTPNNSAVPPVLDPTQFDEKDLTSNWAFSIGLSYRFNF